MDGGESDRPDGAERSSGHPGGAEQILAVADFSGNPTKVERHLGPLAATAAPTVVCISTGDADVDGLESLTVPDAGWRPLGLALMGLRALAAARRGDYAAVVSFSLVPHGCIALAAARLSGVPVHLGTIGADLDVHARAWYAPVVRALLRRFDVVSAPGSVHVRRLDAMGVERAVVLRNPVDVDRFAPADGGDDRRGGADGSATATGSVTATEDGDATDDASDAPVETGTDDARSDTAPTGATGRPGDAGDRSLDATDLPWGARVHSRWTTDATAGTGDGASGTGDESGDGPDTVGTPSRGKRSAPGTDESADDRNRSRTGGGDVAEHDLLWVGRFSAEKDPLLFVRTVSVLRARGLPVTAAMVGDGPLAGAVRTAVERHGLGDAVALPGWVDDPAGRYRRARTFVLTSRRDALPLTLLEAMASGAVPVAPPVGNVGDVVVAGETGVLADRDPASLADAVAGLLADGDRRERLARNAAAVAAEYSMDAAATDWDAVLAALGVRGGDGVTG